MIKLNELERINSPEEMRDFLERKGRNHNYYYHYTTLNSFQKICANQSFLLSRGNSQKINDQHEATMKGSYAEWNKTFFASFSYGSSENMAMWALYGIPWSKAIRIAIPQKAMVQWLESIKEIGVWAVTNETCIPEKIIPSYKCLNDIVYVRGEKGDERFKVFHSGATRVIDNEGTFNKFDERECMTGYVKNYAWHYENEVRLKISVPDGVYAEKIVVDIPDAILTQCTIMTGPCFDNSNDSFINQMVSRFTFEKSGFDRLVRFRTICDLCEHKHFVEAKEQR